MVVLTHGEVGRRSCSPPNGGEQPTLTSCAAVGEAEEPSRRMYATTLAIHAEVQTRGLTTGHDSIRAVVHEAARVPITEAVRRENHAELLQHSEVTRAAVVEGAIGADHLEVIVRTLAKIPANVDVEQRELAESILVEHARELDSGALRRAARHILDWLDQDGPEPADSPEPPVNDLHVDTMRNGEVRFTGHLGPEAGTLLVGLLSPLAKPRSVDGVPDPRGVGERHGDAFAELLQLIANAAAAPIDGGERPHLTLTMSLEDLRAQIGHAQLGGVADLGSLTARQARRLACDAKVLPIVLDGDSQPWMSAAPSEPRRLGSAKSWCGGTADVRSPTCDSPANGGRSPRGIRGWMAGRRL